jgi:YebC/PmpR family DNA-binding regulatory protein
MSGHSKWSSIKHKKAAQDARRGKTFTKLIREISTAARLSGGDPEHNPRLRTAVLSARAANMPSDNIDRAIKKGTGDIPGVVYEEATYEAYGPGGVAILIETLTDNKNRTVAEIRHLLAKHGGNMADAGSVSWMFDPKGQIRVKTSEKDEDELLELILEAGADDMESAGEFFEITTEPHDIDRVKQVLEGAALQIFEAEVAKVPKSIVPVTGKDARQLLKLMNAIEDQDDVQKAWANFDIPDEELEAAEQEA